MAAWGTSRGFATLITWELVFSDLHASDFVASSTLRKLQGSATKRTTFDHICPFQEISSVNLYGERSENVLEQYHWQCDLHSNNWLAQS